MKRVNGRDIESVRPAPGSIWAWLPGNPWAAGLVRVERSFWNGEEWFVVTRLICESDYFRQRQRDTRDWNELSRFWEAAHYVSGHPGAPRSPAAVRRGLPLPDEREGRRAAAR